MDEIDWLVWVVGLVIGSGITWYFSWKYGNRRRKLLFAWDAVQLRPNHEAAGGELKVSFEDMPVQDPYILKITLKNIGASDIATAHFDEGRPLRVEFPDGYVSILDRDMGAVETVEQGQNFLDIQPILLKRGELITLDVLVNGPTTPQLVSKIIDTDIVSMNAKDIALSVVEQAVGVSGGFVGAGPVSKCLGFLLEKRLGAGRR